VRVFGYSNLRTLQILVVAISELCKSWWWQFPNLANPGGGYFRTWQIGGFVISEYAFFTKNEPP